MAETGTALSVVEAQQNIVGGTLVGAAGAGVLAETPGDSTSQILEQIREIQTQTLRAVRSVADGIMEMVAFDKLQDRRTLEDKTENEKEAVGAVPGELPGGGEQIADDADQKTGGFFAFLGGLPGAGFLKKIIAPITAFFGKSGLLVKLFGKFGPLGALILGFTLIYKYSDEIAAALAPAIDKLKVLITKMQPLIDFLIKIGDFFIKTLLENIGGLMENIIDSVTQVVDGFIKLFSGDIIGGLKDIFGGLFDFVLAFPKAILDTVVDLLSPLATAVGDFFKQLYDNIVTYVKDTITNIGNFFIDLKDNIVQFFTDAYENIKTTIKDKIKGIFDPIVEFFSGIGDSIKTVVNNIIDSLPLPKFIKEKMKFETKATQEADNRIDETGVKSKYVDDNITGMQRERISGGGATMQEASAEFTGEKYGSAKITKSGTSGYDSVSAIMTPEEFTEYNKLDTNGQMDYLKALDDDEQERRSMIKKLHEDKLEFDKANKDLINKYKTEPDVMMSPDDQMLQDDKFQREAKIKASTISDFENDNQGAIVVNNNNYNTSNSSVNSQTDVHSGKLDTGIDPYFEKNANNLSA